MRLRLRTDRLARLLAASRLSQNHWALKLGLSRGHWSDIVNGRHPFPSAKTRARMLELFAIPEHELFGAEADAAGVDFQTAVAPRYEIVEELSRDATGTTFRARDRVLGRAVSIKAVSADATAGAALLREIAAVAAASSASGSRPLFDAGEAAGHLYYVTEFRSTDPAPPPIQEPSSPSGRFMRGFRSDLRYAFRSLRRGWRFAAGVILSLGLGVGLGVPVLSLADHFFFRPPPGVTDPDHVVRLIVRGVGTNGPYYTDGLTGLDYATVSTRATTLSGVAGWVNIALGMGRGEQARRVLTSMASASLFPVLGVRPLLGRFYLESEDIEGSTDAPCVISYRFWQRSMNGEPNVLGRTMLVGTVRYTIVGVTPEGFNGADLNAVDMWLPLHVAAPEFQGHDPQLWTTDHSSWLRMVARVKPGVSLATATAEVAQLYRTSGERSRDKKLAGTMLWDALQPGRSSLPNPSAKIALWLSGGGVLLVLLVAANLVNLFVARTAAHARQMAVRLAIGGGWRDMLRLHLTEALVLGACSAVLGLAIGTPAVSAARALILPNVTWTRPIVDLRVAAIAFAIAFGVGAVVALWTTMNAANVDPADLLRGAGAPTMSASRRTHAVRRVLVVSQAAIFAILLTGATAFVASLRRASVIDYGFDIAHLMSASISMPAESPRDARNELYRRAHERVRALPGVESASLGYMEPWSNNTDQPISVPGSTVKPPWTLFDVATPDYLKTFGLRMHSGRWIDDGDRMGSLFVIVINESLEHVFWPAGGGIGQCLRVGADSMPCRTIVGVVNDMHVTGSVNEAPRPVYYIPVAQSSMFAQTPRLFVRARGDVNAAAAEVRRALQQLEPNLPAVEVHPVSRNVEYLVFPLRLGASAFTAFGLLAAIIAAVGLSSVLSFVIVEQRRMHAIKVALGAAPRRIAGGVVANAAATVAGGMAVGYLALIPIGKRLEPMLFRTHLLEPRTIVAVLALGVVVAIAAVVLPVMSVLRTNVMSVLREQ